MQLRKVKDELAAPPTNPPTRWETKRISKAKRAILKHLQKKPAQTWSAEDQQTHVSTADAFMYVQRFLLS